jgi:hypothetical protein
MYLLDKNVLSELRKAGTSRIDPNVADGQRVFRRQPCICLQYQFWNWRLAFCSSNGAMDHKVLYFEPGWTNG